MVIDNCDPLWLHMTALTRGGLIVVKTGSFQCWASKNSWFSWVRAGSKESLTFGTRIGIIFCRTRPKYIYIQKINKWIIYIFKKTYRFQVQKIQLLGCKHLQMGVCQLSNALVLCHVGVSPLTIKCIYIIMYVQLSLLCYTIQFFWFHIWVLPYL